MNPLKRTIISFNKLGVKLINMPEPTSYKSQYEKCTTCGNRSTMNCPNSELCFSTINKPYYKKSEGV